MQETTLTLLDAGLEIEARHRFAFWDCMILPSAKAQGCDVVWSEDMQGGRIVEGVRVATRWREGGGGS